MFTLRRLKNCYYYHKSIARHQFCCQKRLFSNQRCGQQSDEIPSMRFIQFKQNPDAEICLGALSADHKKCIQLTEQNGFFPNKLSNLLGRHSMVEIEKAFHQKVSQTDSISTKNPNLQILSPITEPGKILCVDPNDARKICPLVSNKLTSSIAGPVDNLILPPWAKEICCRTELAVIIGSRARNVDKLKAMDYIFGYSVAQNIMITKFTTDVLSCQPVIVASIDTFCPLGPSIVHKNLIPNPMELIRQCKINGVELQLDSTNGLFYQIDEIIHFITQFVTLMPGDVILTGPARGIERQHRCSPLIVKSGDIIESEIENVGKLKNRVTKIEKENCF